MSIENPRNLVHLALESAKATLAGDHAKVSALTGEIAVRAYQMGENARPVSVSELECGDWIKVRQGVKSHHGVFITQSEVIHATTKHGVISTSLSTFAKERQLHLVRRSPEGERERVVESVRAMIGRPYDVLKSNCEHIASLAHNGEATSGQLEVAGFFAILLSQVAVAMAVDDAPDRQR